MKHYRILGKRGRTTIPLTLRREADIRYNDLLSYETQADGSILIRKEKICNHCAARQQKQDADQPYSGDIPALSVEDLRYLLASLFLVLADENEAGDRENA